MANTIPNIVVPAKTVVDIYSETGITPGIQISVKMIGNGQGKLYSGAALAGEPDNTTGFRPFYPREELINDVDDVGAFIWSNQGCTINVKVV
jgi:hypothetical protein